MRVDLKAIGITGSDAERATVFLIDFRKSQESLIILLRC